jgi:hypothetical protein
MAISNRIGQFVTTCCLLFNQEIMPSLNVACTLGYNQHILQSPQETAVPNICISYLSTLQLIKVSCPKSTLSARPEVLTAVLLNIPVLSDVTLCHLASRPRASQTKMPDPDNRGTTVLEKITVTCLMTPSYPIRLEYSVKTFMGCSPLQMPDKPSTQLIQTLKHSYACCKEGQSVTIHLHWVWGWFCSLHCNVKVQGTARNSLGIK